MFKRLRIFATANPLTNVCRFQQEQNTRDVVYPVPLRAKRRSAVFEVRHTMRWMKYQ